MKFFTVSQVSQQGLLWLSAVCVSVACSGCLAWPEAPVQPPPTNDTSSGHAAYNPYGSQGHTGYGQQNLNRMVNVPPSLYLTAIDKNTWRSSLNPTVLYNLLSKTVLQNYVVLNEDRRNFTIQTDWDKFFIEDRLFRNKMSVVVLTLAPGQSEVMIKNTLEYYAASGNTDDTSAWLPTQDITNEVAKVVDSVNKQTLALYSQMPPKPAVQQQAPVLGD